MKIVKINYHDKKYLNEKLESFKRDFRVRDITIVEDKNVAFIEYEYKSYPDGVRIESIKDISARLYNCLRRNEVETLGELKHYYLTGEIRKFRNLGVKCIKETADILSKNYNADYNQFVNAICKGYNNIDFKRYVKVGLQFYW